MNETDKSMVERIKEAEELAHKTVQEAKTSATSLIEDARIKANNLLKNTRQTCFSEWREKIREAEKQADDQVAKQIEKATQEKDSFFASGQKAVVEVANWLANEVTKSYGN